MIFAKFLQKFVLGPVAVLGLGSLAGAYFNRYGAGTEPVQVMTAELDCIAVGPTSPTEFTGQAVTYIVTTFGSVNGSTDESLSVILTTTIGACSIPTKSSTPFTVGAQNVKVTQEVKAA